MVVTDTECSVEATVYTVLDILLDSELVWIGGVAAASVK